MQMGNNIKYLSEKMLFPIITAVLIAVITALALNYFGVDKNGVPHIKNEASNDHTAELIEPQNNDTILEVPKDNNSETIKEPPTPLIHDNTEFEEVEYYEVKFIYPIDLSNSTLLIDGSQPDIISMSSLSQLVRLKEKSGNFEIELKTDKYHCRKALIIRNKQVISFNLSNDCLRVN